MALDKKLSKRSLRELLELDETNFTNVDSILTELPDSDQTKADPEFCCECEDQPLDLICLDCAEQFCRVCFDYLHRTGKRRDHKVEFCKPIASITNSEHKMEDNIASEGSGNEGQVENEELEGSINPDKQKEIFDSSGLPISADIEVSLKKLKVDASYVPMRLTIEERKLLRLLEAALEVSEYTDRVDIYSYGSKAKRIVRELKEICTVLTGLVVANGLDIGKTLVDDGEFAKHAEWYQSVFEIGRRYKIMNPERMRSSFGKLMYIIMDSRLPEIKQILEFDLYKPVLTVEMLLSEQNALGMLEDPQVLVAIMEIKPEGKSRRVIQNEIRQKERAIEHFVRKFGEPIRQALYSLGDYHSYLESNVTPVNEMILRLRSGFDPEDAEAQYNLGISSGHQGARLTHDHKKQYQYVLQSLTLWREIMGDMFLLWKYADDDLLADSFRYHLEDTSQGLNRVKLSPKVGRLMHTIVARAQRNSGSWVGSSVVHLGDRAVPNALFFLDKYLQVPRILNPVNTVVRLLKQTISSDVFTTEWVRHQFGSIEIIEKIILTDFFRYAFDGSGADNFYDAGSCIDGRLTSAWNWANQLPKKAYYKHFLLSGFVGFDGTEGF